MKGLALMLALAMGGCDFFTAPKLTADPWCLEATGGVVPLPGDSILAGWVTITYEDGRVDSIPAFCVWS